MRLRSGVMPGEHVFVDESKRDVYLVAAAVVAPADLTGARSALRAMQMPGTRRVHFQAESEAFRRKFLARVSELQVTARVYTAGGRTDLDSRRQILTRLVGDLVTMGASRLVIEQDDSVVVHDRRTIKAERARLLAVDSLRFDHLRGVQDPLLWLPDAIAWAWCRNRAWRSLVAGIVTDVTEL
jgi:hypothetical protein